MPLLLLDLDNTLIDRAGAFRRWAQRFAEQPSNDMSADWLVEADRDGSEQRTVLAAMICDRLGLPATRQADMLAQLRQGLLDSIVPDPAVSAALDAARAAGWVPLVITHGTVEQQVSKLRVTGLAEHVAGWIVSERVGLRKPDPAIFRAAAESADIPLAGAWMIGDSAQHDIAGAHRSGLRSVWLHRGRPWPIEEFAPTLTADDCPAAIAAAISTP